MSAVSSACPDNLASFVSKASQATQTLVSKINSLRTSYDEFQTSGGSYPVSNAGLMDAALPNLAQTQENTDTFVTVTKEAFLKADAGASPSAVITVPTATVNAAFNQICAADHINPAQLEAIPQQIQATPMTVGAIPMDSGFVDDPVCTATGHFTESETDLAVPPRLATLAWPRNYSSRLLADTGHGPGWWSWASTRLAVVQPDVVELTCPDGRQGVMTRLSDGSWSRLPGVEATLSSSGHDYQLCWDTTSTWAQQTWTFDRAGVLRQVAGPSLEDCSFDYDREGHLIAIRADSGRSLSIRWRRGLITAVEISDGRSASYDYSADDCLLQVRKDQGDRRYDTDPSGLITAVVDADGVRLCFNTYDDQARVTSQISPLGRETILEYLPNGSTRVRDTEDGPAAVFEHDDLGRLTGVINAEGQRFARSFDEQGRVSAQKDFDGTQIRRELGLDSVTFEAGAGERRTWSYDQLGRLGSCAFQSGGEWSFDYLGDSPLPTVMTDPAGGVRKLEYDQRGLVVTCTDPDGVRYTFTHDVDGMPNSWTDALGQTTRCEYHPSGGVSLLVFADGSTWRTGFDGAGRGVSVIDPLGNQITMGYTPAGRIRSVVDPLGHTTTVNYASSGQVESVTDATGAATEFMWDYLGSPVAVRNPDGSKWEFAYTLLGQLAGVTAPDGAQRHYAHDRAGRITREIDPLGQATTTDYDASGRPVRTTDAEGHATSVSYDAAGNPAQTADAGGAVTRMTWDAMGRMTSRTDPDGVQERFAYTPAGRLSQAVYGGVTRTYHYDKAGRLAAMSSGQDRTWHYGYDARNHLVSVTSPEGRVTTCERDLAGRVVAVSSEGKGSTRRLDAAGRIVAVSDASGATRTYAYDPRDRLLSASDPMGGTTTHRYDLMGRLVEERSPAGGSILRDFDLMGRLTDYTDPLGRRISFAYDLSGRLVQRVSSEHTISYLRTATGRVSDVLVDGANELVYEYDAAGRKTVAHEPARARTDEWEYTPGGRLHRFSSGDRASSWAYNQAGLVAEMTDPLGLTRSYEYHPDGELARVSGAGWGALEVSHDRDGLLTAITGGGTDLSWSYDAGGRLVAYRAAGSATHLGYGPDGRLASVDEGGRSPLLLGYDPAGRLVSAVQEDGRREWAYDAAGRRVAEDGPGGGTRWTYDQAGQLIGGRAGADETRFSFDATGRRTAETSSKSRREYRWDALERLQQIGRLRTEVDSQGLLVAVGDDTIDWDRSRRIPQASTVAGSSVIRVEGVPVALVRDGQVDWQSPDWRGNLGPRGPWGEAPAVPQAELESELGSTAVDAPRISFLGEIEAGGLVWLGQRPYDPVTAQFLARDAMAPVPASAAAGSPYQYANDDPFGWADPSGMRPVSISDFNKTRKSACSFQWGTVASIGVGVLGAVAVMALAPEDLALLPAIAIGVGTGALSGATPALVNWAETGHLNTGLLIKGALVGGIVGGATAGLAPEVDGFAANAATTAGMGAAGGVTSQTLSNVYDYTDLPGSKDVPPDWSLSGYEESAAQGAVTNLASGWKSGSEDGNGSGDSTPAPTQVEPVDPTTVTFHETPSGLEVPDAPNGMAMNPSGLYVPKPGTTPVLVVPAHTGPGGSPGVLSTPPPPAGYTQTPSGIYVPK